MSTTVSPIIQQTECLWVVVNEDADIAEILAEAKELAVREDKMVMFAITAYGQFLQVTKQSDIVTMIRDYFDRYDRPFIIT